MCTRALFVTRTVHFARLHLHLVCAACATEQALYPHPGLSPFRLIHMVVSNNHFDHLDLCRCTTSDSTSRW